MKTPLTPRYLTIGPKELLIVVILILSLPYIINWILIKVNPLIWVGHTSDAATWIGFSGDYIGGIVGCIVSILILNKTLQQTRILHHDLKLLQLDTISYTRKQDWLINLKNELAENLKVIDLYILNTVVSSIAMKNYLYAKDILTEINKNLEYQMIVSSFSFSSAKLSEMEMKYIEIVRKSHLMYSIFIKDILFCIPLMETIASEKKLNYDILMKYTFSQYDYLYDFSELHVNIKTVIPQVMEISPEENIESELIRIMEERMTGRSCLYRLKSELAEITNLLIICEEKCVNSILENKSVI